MKLTNHLSLAEVIRSDTAKRHGISNKPTDAHLQNLILLAENVFEPIREHFDVPIYISSGYRSRELNSLIKGSLTSQHCSGEAIDIDMDGAESGVTNKMVFDFIKENLTFDQLIWEGGSSLNPDWVHVSYESSGKQRNQVLKMKKIGGQSEYTPY